MALAVDDEAEAREDVDTSAGPPPSHSPAIDGEGAVREDVESSVGESGDKREGDAMVAEEAVAELRPTASQLARTRWWLAVVLLANPQLRVFRVRRF